MRTVPAASITAPRSANALSARGHLGDALSLLGLLTLPLAVVATLDAYRYADDIPKLMRSMGFNVLLNIVTPVLMAVGLLLAA